MVHYSQEFHVSTVGEVWRMSESLTLKTRPLRTVEWVVTYPPLRR
jgi:hypothetical protein